MLLPKESAPILSLVHAYIYTYILEKWAIGLKIYFTDLKTLAYPVGLVSLIVPFCKERFPSRWFRGPREEFHTCL